MKTSYLIRSFILSFILSLSYLHSAYGLEVFDLPPNGDDVVGKIFYARVKTGDTLATIAMRYGVGFTQLVKANPNLVKHLRQNDRVVIPSSYILPPVTRSGIVINISELRLFYFPENQNIVITAPVSIGREGWETPIVQTTVIEKIEGPQWHPPDSIKSYMAQKGEILPDVVAAGPNNPLGLYAMRLGLFSYLIHGTNDPKSIGRRISSGCIRMYPADIEKLFFEVPLGTKVTIINEPYKAGWFAGMLFFEAHEPIENNPESNVFLNLNYQTTILQKIPASGLDWRLIKSIAQKGTGYPIRIQ